MNAPHIPRTPLLELDLLKTLVAIHETGNFSAAAEVVFRTPSAVSMQVKRIEELLGRPVFKRDSRSVILTEDGEMLLAHARMVLALNQQLVAKFITPEISGVVRLGAIDHATEQFLPMALRRFAETHPGITVDVTVENSELQETLIKKNELDIAITTVCDATIRENGAEVLYWEELVWAGLKSKFVDASKDLDIQEGDFIFQDVQGRLFRMIEGVTGSSITHCGIIVKKNGQLHVLEAVGPVMFTPLNEWIHRGRTR